MRLLPLLPIVFVIAFAPGCERSTELAGVSEARFVATMAALRRIERDIMLDSAQKAAARDEALQEGNLTPAQLESSAQALARDPAHALEVWARIDTIAMQLRPAPGVEPETEP
jgi:hypothetical protein